LASIVAAGVLLPILVITSTGLSLLRLRLQLGWVMAAWSRDAIGLVHPQDDVWLLTDHHARHPGRGEAKRFRVRLFAHLASEADMHGVTIRLTALPKMVPAYMAEMPGLRPVSWGRLVVLERRPLAQHVPSGSGGCRPDSVSPIASPPDGPGRSMVTSLTEGLSVAARGERSQDL